MEGEGKLQGAEAAAIALRGDVVSYALLAEINHFQRERVIDFKRYMQNYLKEQISFYQKVIFSIFYYRIHEVRVRN